MADPNYAPIGDEPVDDLPRTFRREKEAREREARERAARERAAAPTLTTPNDFAPAGPRIYSETPEVNAPISPGPVVAEILYPAVVRRFEVPFGHLVKFFLKSVVAAIPALILLMAILWGLGHFLQLFFPDLVKMKILIGFGG
jgi:hypothetical protein